MKAGYLVDWIFEAMRAVALVIDTVAFAQMILLILQPSNHLSLENRGIFHGPGFVGGEIP